MQGSESARNPAEAVRVLSVPLGVPIVVRFLGDILGLDTHWKSGRTVPCAGEDECPSSLHRLGVIWRGYAAVEMWIGSKSHWQPSALEVTEALEERLRGRELRGETWSLHRTEIKGKSSPVVGIFCEKGEPNELREAFELEPILRRLFHVARLNLGRRNPLPPRVMLEPVPGKAPRLPDALADAGTPDNTEKEKQEAQKIWMDHRRRLASLNGHSEKNGTGNKD